VLPGFTRSPVVAVNGTDARGIIVETLHLSSNSAATSPAAAESTGPDQDWRQVMTWGVGGSIGAMIGGILGFGTFVLIASAVVGRFTARWYARRRRRREEIIGFVAWSNTLTWLIPLVGMATSVASLTLPGEMHARRNVTLGWIGLVLSIACSMYGVVLNHMV